MPVTTKPKTMREWLTELAVGNSSNESDDRQMQALLRRIQFDKAIVTCGIVYLEGRGTIDAPPMPIQSMAAMILKTQNK